ncbi:MAG: carboxypeptidase-like regulatory domain-containing protein [Gemmatimonadota bacterium]|nr:carboxypeptidase-like regulatory domain-containing protein [Gemmatimonadota bacterium]
MDQNEAAKLLWEEYQYRHDVFWKSLVRWGAANVAISVVPYVRPEIIPLLKRTVLMLPAMAGFLAVAAALQLLGEYRRLKLVGRTFDGTMGIYAPHRIKNSKMGIWVVLFFAFGLTMLAALNAWVLSDLVTAQFVVGRAQVTGTVTRHSGTPMFNTQVTVACGNGSLLARAKTDSSGRYAIVLEAAAPVLRATTPMLPCSLLARDSSGPSLHLDTLVSFSPQGALMPIQTINLREHSMP